MKTEGQSTIELTFVLVAVAFLIFGMVMVFRWAGMDLANRRMQQDQMLAVQINQGQDVAVQLNASMDPSIMPLAAVYHGQIADGNESN